MPDNAALENRTPGTPVVGRLLAIDDEAPIANFIAEVARGVGFEAVTTSDPTTLEPGFLGQFGVVTLDLSMPGVDGIEVLRRIGDAVPPPTVILISGLDQRMLGSARQLATARGLRVEHVLRKPFRSAELRAALQGLVGELPQAARTQSLQAVPDLTLEELRLALAAGELELHFQPQISLDDGAWAGLEALARWRHPRHGLLYPRAFVYLAEARELALPFTEAVLDCALPQLKMLAEQSGYAGPLSVNLPPAALHDVTIPERIGARLQSLQLAPERLIIEMTETSLPTDLTTSLDILTRLKLRGIGLSIDDFGTGHSGMSRLRDAPFDELKIDMDFIRHAERDNASREIVRNAIRLGHAFGMQVVAEGVENEGVLAWLRREGCDLVQGYHVSHPLALPELLAWVPPRRDARA